jgi:uncharacterized membrane protein YhaH (DUF805 family)
MLRYLFSFEGRINRAKFWLYWPIAFVAETVSLGAVWVVGWAGNLDDPMEAMSPFFLEKDHLFSRRLGLAVMSTFLLLYVWTLVVVSVKRLHDRNKSALWALFFWGAPILLFALMSAILFLRLLPLDVVNIVGPFVAIVSGAIMWWGFIEMLFFRGTEGENRFGPDPLRLQPRRTNPS